MGLFSSPKKVATHAVIDIGSSSVGGAYVCYEKGKLPLVLYTARVQVEPREGEELTDAMLRSLAFLEKLLVEEGAPQLRRETGSGAVERVLVSVSAPWQDTRILTKQIQRDKPFVFTHGIMTDALHTLTDAKKGRIESGRTVIATILNGYETANPFGKRVTRAELVALASSLDERTAKEVESSLRRTFHTSHIELTAFAPVAYAVFRDLYPHQKEFVVLDVTHAATDAAFVKRGLLADVRSVPVGVSHLAHAIRETGKRIHVPQSDIAQPVVPDAVGQAPNTGEAAWLSGLREIFSGFASAQALPRTVFLLADGDARECLKRILEGSDLRALWLSDDPLSVVAVAPSHLAPSLATRGMAEGDLMLGLLALYAKGEKPKIEGKE